ncbi:MAG: RNA polymerase sigma-54 factor [Nitrospirae bacterium]|nr:MAG: RNA polymerase sigma-54 factor [Nitrospirota bacterium]
MELRLDLKLTQKLVMTPQLQQAIKLLQLSRLDLQQEIAHHLEENPLLEDQSLDVQEEELAEPQSEAPQTTETEDLAQEEGDEDKDFKPLSSEEWDEVFNASDWRAGGESGGADDDLPSFEQTLTRPTSLEEHLEWQLRLSSLTGKERAIGRIIIGNLDEDGYLRMSLEEVAEDAQVSVEEAARVLEQVQTFDPPGVAARDLRECLLIQLAHLERDPIGVDHPIDPEGHGEIVKAIVADHLHDLQKKRYTAIAKALSVPVEEVYAAVKVIEGLEPKPGRPYFSDNNSVIIPDVYVVKHEGEWIVLLNEDGLPRLRINPYYRRLLSGQHEAHDSTRAYLEDKLRGAQWIIRSIDQRNKTIVKVVKSLIKFQEPFLEKGIKYLKPLVLKQVAEDVGMHESTISRVTTNKYMHCPQGILELKFFFSAGIQRADHRGEEFSSVTVREMIRELVANEDGAHPLRDQEIVAKLREKNILIARRTVAKYRAELNISSASQRKRIPT